MSKKTIEMIILSIPIACFALLLLSLLGMPSEAIKNISWIGSIAGLPVGIIAKVRKANSSFAIANISIGIFTLILMAFLIGVAVFFVLVVDKGAEGFVNFINAIKLIG